MATEVVRHRFSVADYERMIAVGILTEEDRVELVDGEIVEMSPQDVKHARCIAELTEVITSVKPRELRLGVQLPIRLPDHSEPEPDLVVYRKRAKASTHPLPEDILLVIEVSNTTRNFDRNTKLPLYAAAGIPEAWMVDLAATVLERHTEPGPQGYRVVTYARRGESLDSTTLSGLSIALDDIVD